MLTACFSHKVLSFETLSLPICYLIFQFEVFLDVVATGSGTGIEALVTCMRKNSLNAHLSPESDVVGLMLKELKKWLWS